MEIYPFLFEPIFKPRIWGGRRLADLLNKRLPPDGAIGESWEIADLQENQSVVANGPARGIAIQELVRQAGSAMTGRAPLAAGRFPFLLKYLDATESLSIQVHPDAKMAKQLGGDVLPKEEAWYVVHAEPDAFIYRGLRPGIGPAKLEDALHREDLESVLNRIPARNGHCYYLPGGTIHALGRGVVVAEVQTPSDVTYRLYDWRRVDTATGRPRELHRDAALRCVRFDPVQTDQERKQHVASVWTSITSLVRCPSFVVERVRMVEGVEQPLPHQEMVVWMILEGRGSIHHDGPASPVEFAVGDTVLLPAGLRNGRVRTHQDCMWLEVTTPIPSTLAGYDRPEPESPIDAAPRGERFVPLNLPRK